MKKLLLGLKIFCRKVSENALVRVTEVFSNFDQSTKVGKVIKFPKFVVSLAFYLLKVVTSSVIGYFVKMLLDYWLKK